MARPSLLDSSALTNGQYDSHRRIAQALAIPVPGPSESVSVRLARRRPHHAGLPFVTLSGDDWVVAQRDDPAEPAPILPDVTA
jgi:Restriction endonuclease NaeI